MPVPRGILPAAQFLLVANPAIQLTRGQTGKLQAAMAAAGLQLGGLQQRGDRSALLMAVFGSAAASLKGVNTLVNSLKGPGLGLQVQLRGAAEMNGAVVAYAPKAPGGAARVYLSAAVLENGFSSPQISLLLLKAAGHHIDARLNGSLDTAGDEGSSFVSRLLGRRLTALEQALLGREAAGGVISIDGSTVTVESQTTNNTSTSTSTSTTITVTAVNGAPQLGSLSAISLTDTRAQDSFSASSGTLSASDPEGDSLRYGLTGASDLSASGGSGPVTFDGISYDLSKAGSYGTLYLNSSTGQYRFQPKSDWQLNALSSSGTDSFELSVSDGSNTTSTTLQVNFTGSSEAPEQYVLVDDGSPVLTAQAQSLWEQALTNASRILSELLARSDRDALLNDVFGRAGTDTATFEANKAALIALLGGAGLQIDVDLRSNEELNGALAAYAAIGHTGKERIYVNGDLLNSGVLDLNLATSALLEEFGSAIDQRLNAGIDSPGDEGQAFASLVTGITLTAEQRAVIDAEDDRATLTIEGVQVLVEEATVTTPTTTTTTLTGLTRANLGTKGSSSTEVGWLTSNDGDTSAFQFKETNDRLVLDFGVTLTAGTSINFSLDNRSNPNTIFLTPVADIDGSNPASADRSSLRTTATSNGYNSYSLILLTDARYLSFSSLDTNETRISFVNATYNLLEGTGTSDFLRGTAAIEVLNGGGGNDILEGDPSSDSMSGGEGYDSFFIAPGDSTIFISGTGNAGVISGYDIITDFALANGSAVSEALRVTTVGTNASIPTDASSAQNGTDSVLSFSGTTFVTHHTISKGIIGFRSSSTNVLELPSSYSQIAALVDYLRRNDFGNAGATVAFTTASFNEGGFNGARTYVYSQHTNNAPGASGTSYSLIELRGIAATSLTTDASTTTDGALFISNNLAPIVSGNLNGFTVTEDVTGNLQFSGTPFTDVDTTSNLTVTLSIADGTIAASSGGNVTIGGTATARTFSGTAAALNTFFTTAGNITYTTAQNNDTTRTLTVSVSDGALSNSATTTVNITAVNDAPTLNSASLKVQEGQTVTLSASNFSVTDPDNSSFTYTVSGVSGGFFQLSTAAGTAVTSFTTAQLNSGSVQFIDNGDESAPSFSVTVNDGSANSGTVAASISFTNVNDAPVATAKTISSPEDTGYIFSASDFGFTDSDSNSLQAVIISSLPTAGNLRLNGLDVTLHQSIAAASLSSLVFTPALNANGTNYASFGFRVQDSGGTENFGQDTSAEATITISITPVNDAPLINANGVNILNDIVREVGFDVSNPRTPVAFMQANTTNLADIDSDSFSQITVSIRALWVQNGSSESLLIKQGADVQADIRLAPTTEEVYEGVATFTLNGLEYRATLSGVADTDLRRITFSRMSNGNPVLMSKQEAETLLDSFYYTNTAPAASTAGRRTFELTATDAEGAISNATDVVFTLGKGPEIDLDGNGQGFEGVAINRQISFTENNLPVKITDNGSAEGGLNLKKVYETANYTLIGEPIAGLTFTENSGSWSYNTAAYNGPALATNGSHTFTVPYSWTSGSDSGQHVFQITVTNTGAGLVASSNRPLIGDSGTTISGQLAASIDRLGVGINLGLFKDEGQEFFVIQGAVLTSANGQQASGAVQLSFRSAPSTALGEKNGAWGTFTLGETSYRYEFVKITDSLNRIFFTRNTDFGIGGTLTYGQAEALIDAYAYLNTSENPATTSRTLNFGAFSEGLGNIPATATIEVVAENDAPVLASPDAVTLTDTSAFDPFAPVTGSLIASDVDSSGLTFSISGSTASNFTSTASGTEISYDLQKAGTYGTLYLQSSTGRYLFVPNSNATLNSFISTGSESFSVSVSDGAKNDSKNLTINFTGAIETPTLTLRQDTGSSGGDGITSNGTVDVGNLDADTTWSYSIDNGLNWSPGSGTSFLLPAGTYASGNVQVRQTAGGVNGASGSLSSSVTVDTTAPTITITAIGGSDSTISGLPADNLIQGKAEPGLPVSIVFGGIELGTAETNEEGVFSYALSTNNITDIGQGGDRTITFSQIDLAGNKGSASSKVKVDTVAPNTPNITTLLGDSGRAGDNITNVTTPTLLIQAESGSSVSLLRNGDTVGKATETNTAGLFSFTSAILTDGIYSFTATSTDAAGNISGGSGNRTITIDTQVATPGFSLSSDTGSFKNDWVSRNGQINVSGIDNGATWQYSTNAGSTWLPGSGTSFVLLPGTYATGAVRVRQIDIAGNTSASASNTSGPIVIDTTAPTVSISAATLTLNLVGDGEDATSESTLVTFTFSEDPGSSFSWDGTSGDVVVNGGTLGALSGTGLTRTATFTPRIDFVGTATLGIPSGRFNDLAGNDNVDGEESNNRLAFDVNTLRSSSAPVVAISSNSSRIRSGQTAVITFTFNQPPTGFSSEDVSITATTPDDGTVIAGTITNPTVNPSDARIYTATYTPAADLEATVTITVAAGSFGVGGIENVTNSETSLSISVDTNPPAQVASVAFTADSGTQGDFITNDPNQNIDGTVSGALSDKIGFSDVVKVSIDAGVTWRLATIGTDRSSFQLENVTLRGPSTIWAYVEDESGNTSEILKQAYVYDPITFTGELLLTGFSGNFDAASRRHFGSDSEFTLSMPNSESGATLSFERSSDGGSTWEPITHINGSALQTELTSGTYLYRGKAVDAAGNQATSSVITVIVDNTAPSAPSLSLTADALDDSVISATELRDGTGVLRLSAEDGATVQLRIFNGSDTSGTATVSRSIVTGGSTQAITLSSIELSRLLDGTVTITAVATDRAGNPSELETLSFTYQAQPVINLGSISVETTTEGREENLVATEFTLTRVQASEDSPLPVFDVRYVLTGSALAGVDYIHADANYMTNGYGVARFEEGQTTTTVTLATLDNSIVNGMRDIRLSLVDPVSSYTLISTDRAARAILADNDVAVVVPTISISNVSILEGASGATTSTRFILSLSQATTVPVSFTYTFRSGSATAGSDFAAPSGPQTATFNPGSTSLPITFSVLGDSTVEQDEFLYLDVSNPVNGILPGSIETLTATATIINDDTEAQVDPTVGIIITSSGNFSGSDRNDVLTGDAGINQISGLAGNDTIAGLGGADTLTGGTGADVFAYPSLSDSTLSALDRINDFNTMQGDRIGVATIPNQLWNVGIINAGSLAAAMSAAFADKDLLSSGNQSLAVGESVIFVWGATTRTRSSYLAIAGPVNDSNADDLLINLPNNTLAIGSLNPADFFAAI